MKKYKILKLKSGEDIIGTVRISRDGNIKIHRPMIFKSMVQPEEIFDDPFNNNWEQIKKSEGLSPNFRRQVNRLEKSFMGHDDSKSKKLDPLDLTGYSLFQIVQPPYNILYLAQLYDVSPYHHSAVNAKAANVVGLGYKFEETWRTKQKVESVLDNPKKLDKIRAKLEQSKEELRDYLESMNSEDSFIENMKKVFVDLESTGNAYLEVGRTSTGKIGYLGHIPTQTMRIRRHRDGFVQVVYNRYTFFRNFGDTETPDQIGTDPNPNEVIHFKVFTPSNTYYGVPDVLSAKNAVAGDEFAQRFNLDYFENKAVPRYIITVKGAKLTADSERKLLEFFQTGLRGRNHRTLYIPLPSDGDQGRVEFKMDPIEAGVQDSSFKNYAVENRDRILLSHRVPVSKLGMPANVSLANAKDADKTFKEQVCRPRQEELEFKINKIISEFTDAFTLRFNELALTDEETQSRIDDRYLKDQVLLPNEVRARKGLAPISTGDTVLVLNPKQATDAISDASGNKTRDQNRTINAPDKMGTGRNPKGEGSQEGN
jgi:PBSX family phage portal protein